MSHEANNQQPDNEQIARRRLLKAAVYTPPVVLGSMISMPQVAEAISVNLPIGSFSVSAATSACNPCNKLINGTSIDPLGDALNCLKNQCTNLCTNCDTFVANAVAYGKTTCQKCEKVTKGGCVAPAACTTATNKKGGACCDQTLTTCKY